MPFVKTALLIFTFGVLSLIPYVAQSHDAPKTQRTLVLPYQAFGPQVLAHELIGFEWYQWNSHGSSNPLQYDDVRVVVYRNIPLSQVKKQFPVIRERHDYRYLSYHDALAYCNQLLRMYSQWALDDSKLTDVLAPQVTRIEQTKQSIHDHFDR